jgi:hypothetical protein
MLAQSPHLVGVTQHVLERLEGLLGEVVGAEHVGQAQQIGRVAVDRSRGEQDRVIGHVAEQHPGSLRGPVQEVVGLIHR